MADEKRIQELIEQLVSQNLDMKQDAADSLVQIGKPAVPALIGVLRHENNDVRWFAEESLIKIGKPAVPALIRALEKEDDNARLHIILIAENIGDISAVPALVDALKDKYQDVRVNAARILGYLGNYSVIPALIESLEDENEKDTSEREGAGDGGVRCRSSCSYSLLCRYHVLRRDAGRKIPDSGWRSVRCMAQEQHQHFHKTACVRRQ